MSLAYIGLGSNLGSRSDTIRRACNELINTGDHFLIKVSSLEETAPVDFLEQPFFLNQIILIKTEADPEMLLKVLKGIEIKLGRKKGIPKGPRIIDMDILLYDDIVYRSPALIIPHPEIMNRKFILKHLLEIDPALVDPVTGIPYREIYEK